MNAMQNERAIIGGNNPPDPIDEATAPFDAAIHEAANWLDGRPVENEAQMKAVDAILADIKAWRKSLDAAKKSATAPLHDAWKAEIARWKPTEEDQQRIEKGLVAAVDGYKRKLAAEKAEAERKAQREAWEAMRAARAAAEAAAASDLEAQRAADAAKREAEEAVERARAASKDTVKGLRAYDVTEVLDGTGLARWIWQNDREPLMAWLDEYARRRKLHIPGIVETRQERRAV